MHKLDIIFQRRKEAADALYLALSSLLDQGKPFSEADLRDKILLELRKNKSIFPDGWYNPPPHGIGVLFSTDTDFKRSNFISLRYKEFWPQKNIFLDRENGFITLHTSCVDKKENLLADFGLTLYFGKNKTIQKNIARVLKIQKQIAAYVKLGMRISDVYGYADSLFKANNYSNDWWMNITDPSGKNIGHTFPGSEENWTKSEKEIFKNGKWEDVCGLISKKRIFISPDVHEKIRPGMVFTIEPRLKFMGKPELPIIYFHGVVAFDEKGTKHFATDFDKLLTLSSMKKKKITYSSSGVNYETLDPVKKFAQNAALDTSKNLKEKGFTEITDTRGESAYVWKQGTTLMATVIEGLGTKNLVADAVRKKGKTYYQNIAHDTVSAIINDLISVGARPLTIHAYWAVGDSKWLADEERTRDLIKGWRDACDFAGVSWGGGETPTYSGIINPETIDLGGSAVGFIKNKKQLITDKKIKERDRIIFIKSNGINVNGLSLARAVAKKLPQGFHTTIGTKTYGELLLSKSNIYARLIGELFDNNIDIHYLVNISGHGFRKIMRGKPDFKYVIESIFQPQEVFNFIQKHAELTAEEMYGTYNMGQDYAIFIPKKDVKKTLDVIKKNKFQGMDAGYIEKGKRQVIIKPKDIIYDGSRLDLR